MSSPAYAENYQPEIKQAGGFMSKLPIKLTTAGSTTFTYIVSGTGVPSASLPQGSLYLRTDGSSTSTRLYVATNNTGTWTAVTTAA